MGKVFNKEKKFGQGGRSLWISVVKRERLGTTVGIEKMFETKFQLDFHG